MTTFVLLHGAWHGAWCWDRLRPVLEAHGHAVVTPELPYDVAGTGRADYLAALDAVLDQAPARPGGAVVVAHSMSGLVAPLAAGRPGVAALILLAAMVPRPGAAWLEAGPAPYAAAMRERAGRMRFDDELRSSWDAGDATALFYNDATAADAAAAVARLRPNASLVYGEQCPALPERRVPAAYVSCTRDQAVDGAWNAAAAAELLAASEHEIDAGHSPFWTAPEELAALLEKLS